MRVQRFHTGLKLETDGVENSERTVRFPMMTDYIGAVASAVSAEPGVFYACRSLYIVCSLE